MDAWSHLLFAFTIAILLDFYPIQKAKKLLLFMIIIEVFNLVIAIFGSDLYNLVGLLLRGPVIGYLLYERHNAKNPQDKAMAEMMAVVLFFASYVAAASHNYDIFLERAGYQIVANSIRRGHNLWHTPFYALSISLFLTILIFEGSKILSRYNSNFKLHTTFLSLFLASFVGYISHILGDILVFDFQIYWLFPVSFIKLGIMEIINEGVLTKKGTPEKPEGTTYYWGNIFFVGLFLLFMLIKYLNSSSQLGKKYYAEGMDF